MSEKAIELSNNSQKTLFGFWVYLMSDVIIFATLFATFAVLRDGVYGGESGKELFSMPYVLTETMILLTSSFTCGIALLAYRKGLKKHVIFWLTLTFLLGASFLALELNEFSHLVSEGNSWRESAFLSAFFTLVGTHGIHITVGLIWIIFLLIKLVKDGFTESLLKRFTMFGLFWHFLDVIWIFIFTFVFLIGSIS